MSAARRSTTSPISATRGRSSCSTCCSGCCAMLYGESHVTYVRNITDVDDKINARARGARRAVDPRGDRGDRAHLPRATWRRSGCLPPDRRAARHRAYRRDDRDDREADRARASPMWPRGMCCSTCRRWPTARRAEIRRAVQPLARRDDRRRPRRRRALQARRRWISCCGSRPRPTSRAGTARGARGRPGWHIECSAMSWKHLGEESSTSTAAASTWSSPTTRTRSRRPAAPSAMT